MQSAPEIVVTPSLRSGTRQLAVKATISRDFAEGNLARERAALQNLASKAHSAADKSKGVGDLDLNTAMHSMKEAVQIKNTDLTGLSFSPSGARKESLKTPDQSLQDYQMHMMLLEQQNKKRLDSNTLERKQPKEVPESLLAPLNPAVPVEPLPVPKLGTAWQPDMVPQGPESKKRHAFDTNTNDILGQREGDTTALEPNQPKRARHVGGSQTAPRPFETYSQPISSGPNAENVPLGNAESARPRLSAMTPPTANISSVQAGAEHSASYGFCILHQIICHSSFHSEKGKIFKDDPSWSYAKKRSGWDQTAHLSGNEIVRNIPDFIEKAGRISFIIFRYYRCGDASRWDHARQVSSSALRFDEAIGLVTRPLQEAIDKLSLCASDPSSYYPSSDGKGKSKTGDQVIDFEPDEYTMEYFYHHRHAIDAAAAQADDDLREQLHSLQAYLNSRYGTAFREIDVAASSGLVRSENISLLFCPNDIIVSKTVGGPKASVLRAWPVKGSAIRLECWNWAYDGHWLHRAESQLAITRPIQPWVKIQELEAYPLRYASKDEIKHLEARGHTFWSLRHQSFVAYNGWDLKAEHYYTNDSRWMVDYKTYRQMHPGAQPFQFTSQQKAPFDQWAEQISHDSELSHRDMLVPPSHIHGFSFKKKDWNSLLIDAIKPIKWNKEAFTRLVLPDRMKDMVRSLVMVRAAQRGQKERRVLDSMRDDLIAGKGNGLIMLLHGSPGTGKTLTAESVAELAEMPLYSVTCGDIGTKPEVVETYLETVLMLGKRWNCVLLLDEADVFLEERSLADLERNSLVSVFLRTLEYYDGILILTSNRIGTFDAAFTSRIQVALHYEALSAASRRKIWLNFFDMLQNDGPNSDEDVDMEDIKAHLDEVAGHEMNGRQIRNVFTTARQLAVFKKEKLTWDHLDQALRSVGDFNRYLRRLHGHSEEQWARDEKLR